MDNYFLKPNVKVEPLIWNWYAWSHLIPPLTAGCNILERHLKIMQSYVLNPQIHKQAVKDPKMLGGPFIDLDGQRIDEVKDLIKKTQQDCKELILLTNSMKEYNRVFQIEAKGDSLHELYKKVPQPLKGLLELVYDLNNRPSIRLIEPLIYNKFYLNNNQKIALSFLHKDFRKFILSTPRLEEQDEVYIEKPFSSPNLDLLFKMRDLPQNLKTIQEIFEIPKSKEELFKSFFSNSPPLKPEDRNYGGNGIRLRYFGHACALLQTKSVSILIDPVISYPVEANEVLRYTLADLPDFIDYVVITHNHQDHFMFETLLQLRYKIGHIVFPTNNLGALEDPSIKLILKNLGFSSLIEMKEMETISFEDGEIMALPFLGEHGDLHIQTKLAYHVRLKDTKFVFAVDSNNIEPALYDHIFKAIGKIDVLFIGMECDGAPLSWVYGPLLSDPLKRVHDTNRTLSGSNFDKAWKLTEKSGCHKAYVYAMGQEPWLNFIMALKYDENSPQIIESNKFIAMCKENSIESERLFGKKEWLFHN